MSSVHDKLDRVRKPRVHIKAEVETEGAKLVYDLPFVVGVMGDFSGDPTGDLKSLADRNFVEIDRDNINGVLKKMKPGLNLRVENTLKGDDSELAVQLKFESMEDFEPVNVARQVEPLRKLLDTRSKLRDLMTKVDLSSDLESVLEDVLKDSENVAKLAGELGIEAPGDAPEGDE
jgi:type VI secretion system protein ImpB